MAAVQNSFAPWNGLYCLVILSITLALASYYQLQPLISYDQKTVDRTENMARIDGYDPVCCGLCEGVKNLVRFWTLTKQVLYIIAKGLFILIVKAADIHLWTLIEYDSFLLTLATLGAFVSFYPAFMVLLAPSSTLNHIITGEDPLQTRVLETKKMTNCQLFGLKMKLFFYELFSVNYFIGLEDNLKINDRVVITSATTSSILGFV